MYSKRGHYSINIDYGFNNYFSKPSWKKIRLCIKYVVLFEIIEKKTSSYDASSIYHAFIHYTAIYANIPN